MTGSKNKSSKNTGKALNKEQKIWYLYIIETRYKHWYTGITTDVDRRFKQHVLGQGAKNLKGKGPLKLIMSISVGDRSKASILESKVKKLTKAQKILWANEPGEII